MSKLKLYFAPGACSRVPLVMLEKTVTAFETELVVFMRGDHRAPNFLALNPSGKIPVLKVNNDVITQNAAILLWLHERFGNAGILPKTENSLERNRLLGRLLAFSSDLHPLVTRIRMPQFFCDLEGAPGRVAQMGREAMGRQLASYEEALAGQNWLSGSDWSALDAYLHWVWFRITGAGFDPKPYPAISSHYERTLEIPAFQRAIARENQAQAWLDENGFAVKFAKT